MGQKDEKRGDVLINVTLKKECGLVLLDGVPRVKKSISTNEHIFHGKAPKK